MGIVEAHVVWNEDFCCWQLKEPVAKFGTGFIIELYRIDEDLVIVEHVMVGLIHVFLEAYFVYTRTGLSICQSLGLRGYRVKDLNMSKEFISLLLNNRATSERAKKRLINALEILYNCNMQKGSKSIIQKWLQLHSEKC